MHLPTNKAISQSDTQPVSWSGDTINHSAAHLGGLPSLWNSATTDFTQALIKPSLADLETVANGYSHAADAVAHSLVGKGTWLDSWTRRLHHDVLHQNYNIGFDQSEEDKLAYKPIIGAIDDIEKDQSMERCQRGLMRSSFERLMQSIAVEFAESMETGVLANGRFTQAGGILLRREVQESIATISALIDHQHKRQLELQVEKAGELSGQIDSQKDAPTLAGFDGSKVPKSGAAHIRPLFARMDQIAQVLAIDEPKEVLEIQHPLVKLNPGDINTVLKMRVDFAAEAVGALGIASPTENTQV